MNWVHVLIDLTDWAAFVFTAYNIELKYALLYVLPFELIFFKAVGWWFFLRDLKKADRGFFMGD